MKFEHLVEINDLLNPLIDVITREQLWRGLVLRAEMPRLFVSYLDDAIITDRTEVSMTRRLRYGDLIVNDTVTFSHQNHVHYEVPAQGDIPSSTLRMIIEEPQPEQLFVRFIYEDGNTDNAGDADQMYNDFRKSAYEEADIDTVRIIRELADSGRLDAPLN